MADLELMNHRQLFIRQVREVAELFGYETRNKYQILDTEMRPVLFAAEQGKGVFGFLVRQYLGHWRTFDVHFMNNERQIVLVGHHPFRWFFQRIEVRDSAGEFLGAIHKRFSVFSKKFDVQNERGMVILQVESPLHKFWTFAFSRQNREVAVIKKKWSGLFSELFTDKDVFLVEYSDPTLSATERTLVLASSIFIDLLYFERKAN